MGINQANKKLRSTKNRIRRLLPDVIISTLLIGLGFGLGLIKGVEFSEPYPLIKRRLEEIVEEVPQEGYSSVEYYNQIAYHKALVDIIKDYTADHLYSIDLTAKLICDVAVPRMSHTPQMDYVLKHTLRQYNFTQEASDYILENITLQVLNPNTSEHRGGIYCEDIKTIFSYTRSQETIVHESAHSSWENLSKDEELRREFIMSVVRLANMKPDEHPLYANAINLVHDFVYDENSDEMFKQVEDPNNLTDEDFERLIKFSHRLIKPAIDDDEMYASIASFTMGNIVSGENALPPFMWKYFAPLFNASFPDYVSWILQYQQGKMEEVKAKIAELKKQEREQELQQIYALPETAHNIALLADVSASSYVEGFPPELAVDGEVLNPASAWLPESSYYAEWDPFKKEYLIVDLGRMYKIDKIDVFAWSRNPHDWYQKFRIELSDTGMFSGEQRRVVVENDWDKTRESHKPFNQFRDWEPAFFVRYSINKSGRYVKIISDEPQAWASLEEIMVYGEPEESKPIHGFVE